MRNSRLWFPGTVLSLAVALTGWGCAATAPAAGGASPPDGVHLGSDVDRAPRLIACSDGLPAAMPSQISGVRVERVTLRYVVDADGQVEPDWLVVTGYGWHGARGTSGASVEEAKQRALSCRYKPALSGDRAVRAVAERTFSVSVAES